MPIWGNMEPPDSLDSAHVTPPPHPDIAHVQLRQAALTPNQIGAANDNPNATIPLSTAPLMRAQPQRPIITFNEWIRHGWTLMQHHPWLMAAIGAVSLASIAVSYRISLQRQAQLRRRRRILALVKRHFSAHKLDILEYLYEQRWNHLTPQQLEHIWERFKMMIHDKNVGVIPLSELAVLHRRAGIKDDKVALACARFWDVDGTCSIDFLDFVQRLNLVLYGTKEEQLRAFFHVFDLNNDGMISMSEMDDVLTALSIAPQGHLKEVRARQHAQVEELFRHCQAAEPNRRGYITLDEFLSLANIPTLSPTVHPLFLALFGLDQIGTTSGAGSRGSTASSDSTSTNTSTSASAGSSDIDVGSGSSASGTSNTGRSSTSGSSSTSSKQRTSSSPRATTSKKHVPQHGEEKRNEERKSSHVVE